MIDLQAYLDRIGFHDPPRVNRNTLFKLQKQHLLSILFENLDIHYKKKISLSLDAIYQKVIIEKRGGFCYELNGLFHQLLLKIGFDALLISARVHTENEEYSPEYDHLAIVVHLEAQNFLVDVGFGKFSLEPLALQTGQRILDPFGQFQFDAYDRGYYRINEVESNDLLPQYIFRIEERELAEFKERCEFHQTSKDSHFTKNKLISIAKTNGRMTLTNTQLKITLSGIEKEVNFEESEFENRLKQYFDIDI